MRWPEALLLLGGSAAVTFVLGAVLVRAVLRRLPADYFVRPSPERSATARIGLRVVGGTLVALGIAMLVLPGPGFVAIAIGLVLYESPAKRALLARVLARPTVRRALGRLRARAGKAPFVLAPLPQGEEEGPGPLRR